MSEYIHSGVAGKINRIIKPHIGNILVTSEFGNAKESTLTEATLKTAVNDINRIKYAVTYKGEKDTVDALPTTGNTKGDMWNVTENGHNYAWTGSEWDDLGGTAVGGTSSEWEWNPTPFYEETLANQFNYNSDLPFTAGKNINLTNIVQANNKLTHLLLTIERVAPTYGNTTGNNNNELTFAFPVYDTGGAGYVIFGKTATTTATTKTKHFLIIKPYYGFTKVKYFYYQLTNTSTINLDPNYIAVSNLESSFEDILVNDLILSIPSVSITSDLGAGTIIKAYTKKDN